MKPKKNFYQGQESRVYSRAHCTFHSLLSRRNSERTDVWRAQGQKNRYWTKECQLNPKQSGNNTNGSYFITSCACIRIIAVGQRRKVSQLNMRCKYYYILSNFQMTLSINLNSVVDCSWGVVNLLDNEILLAEQYQQIQECLEIWLKFWTKGTAHMILKVTRRVWRVEFDIDMILSSAVRHGKLVSMAVWRSSSAQTKRTQLSRRAQDGIPD